MEVSDTLYHLESVLVKNINLNLIKALHLNDNKNYE